MLLQGNHSALASPSSSAAFAPTPFPPPAFHSPTANRHLHHHQFPTTPAPDDPTASFMAAASAVQSANAVDGAQRVQSMQLPSTLAPWQIQQISEEEFFATLPVFDMFPLSNGDENHVILYALLYAVLFLVGVCGNVSVITLIRHLHANTSYDNTMIYVLFLCCVDLASVVPLPMAIMDQLLGFWMFGTALCKVYRALEHVGRALSTFVLAAMAFDRFLRVCYPHKKTSRRVVLIQLLVLTMLTFVLLSPLLIKSSSREIVLKEVLLENPYRLARVRIFKCMDHLEGTLLSVFITYMFLIGFFLPVFLITVFYILMMRRLFKRSRTMSSSKLPVNRIAVYTIAISVFFVICWSPYWISMLYFNFMHWENEESERNSEDIFSSDKFIYIMYGIHALPYVNSASNWLLYGLLNSQLMRRAKYPNESTYYAGVGENGFGPYGGSIRLGTHPSTTPPQPSTIRFGSGSTTMVAQQNGGIGGVHNNQQQQQHSSLTVMTSSNGGGRCSSTLSAPVFGRGRKAAKANGQMIHAGKCPLSPSPSARSISTVSAPPRTPMLGTTAATNNAPSAATMLMANSESDTELGGSIGGGSLNKPPLNGSLGGGHGVDKEARQRLLASDNDILL